MSAMALDMALADQLLGMIERTPSDVPTLARLVHRSNDEVLAVLIALQAWGVPIEHTQIKGTFAFKPHVVHLNTEGLALGSAAHAHILRAHVIESSHTWLVAFLSGKKNQNPLTNYAHKHPLFIPQKNAAVTDAFVVLPEFQTQGVGRQGRTWHSGYAQGALCSVAQWLPFPPHRLTGLSLACGAEIAVRLNEALPKPQHVQLKWPNDLIRLNSNGYDKVGGVLVELVPSEDDRGCWLVVGVGVNVGRAPELVSMAEPETHPRNTPASVTGLSRQQVVELLLGALSQVLSDYPHLGFGYWRTAWQNLHAFDKKNVLIEQACGTLRGICDGVDDCGALLLATPAGQKRLYSGDVSLRPVPK